MTLDDGGGEDIAQLRAELQELRLTALRKKAVETGVTDDVLDDAVGSRCDELW